MRVRLRERYWLACTIVEGSSLRKVVAIQHLLRPSVQKDRRPGYFHFPKGPSITMVYT